MAAVEFPDLEDILALQSATKIDIINRVRNVIALALKNAVLSGVGFIEFRALNFAEAEAFKTCLEELKAKGYNAGRKHFDGIGYLSYVSIGGHPETRWTVTTATWFPCANPDVVSLLPPKKIPQAVLGLDLGYETHWTMGHPTTTEDGFTVLDMTKLDVYGGVEIAGEVLSEIELVFGASTIKLDPKTFFDKKTKTTQLSMFWLHSWLMRRDEVAKLRFKGSADSVNVNAWFLSDEQKRDVYMWGTLARSFVVMSNPVQQLYIGRREASITPVAFVPWANTDAMDLLVRIASTEPQAVGKVYKQIVKERLWFKGLTNKDISALDFKDDEVQAIVRMVCA